MTSVADLADQAVSSDVAVVAGLRAGDEEAFRRLVTEHQAGLRRFAAIYVPHDGIDDVVQETWIAVIKGISGFEGRSSLKTWIYRILINLARKRFAKEGRSIPFSASGVAGSGVMLEADRLMHPTLGPNYWSSVPRAWHADPEGRSLAAELREVVSAAIDALPGAPREVITLRDVEGWSADEVCDALGISAVNQRVQLHRARIRMRQALEEYFGDE